MERNSILNLFDIRKKPPLIDRTTLLYWESIL